MTDIYLTTSLRDFGHPHFLDTLKSELNMLDRELLPLHKCLVHSNYVADAPMDFVLLQLDDNLDIVRLRLGIFFQGVNAGSCCADDPSTIQGTNEYCEITITLEKSNAKALIDLADN